MRNKENNETIKQIHHANLLKTLQHRLEVARTNGQTELVNQLEAEKLYYLS